jgi:hypothetical protein
LRAAEDDLATPRGRPGLRDPDSRHPANVWLPVAASVLPRAVVLHDEQLQERPHYLTNVDVLDPCDG